MPYLCSVIQKQSNHNTNNTHKMTRKIHFTKMHGAGNDYIYVDTLLYNIEDPSAASRAWSDRHKGIGGDGLVLIGRADEKDKAEADFTMRIFNADGSEAMMCGNASRCVGKYLYDNKITTQTQIRLLTLSGVKVLDLHLAPEGVVDSVTVDMNEPILENKKQFISNIGILPDGTFVSMGNPHYVIFVDDIEAVNVAAEGSRLEHHPAFPERCNIEFAEVRPDGIRVRVWERGSGITMACGTGACATAVAAALTGRQRRCSHIIMDGGNLDIEWRETDNHVYMTGPATFVFEGDIEL
jgi:diaminopimelate epimerase